jgi:hypothetical protein
MLCFPGSFLLNPFGRETTHPGGHDRKSLNAQISDGGRLLPFNSRKSDALRGIARKKRATSEICALSEF